MLTAAIPSLDYSTPIFPGSGWMRRCLTYVAAGVGVWLFLVLHLLPSDVMGERLWNEADVLPLARQSADPNWMPNDWYLNQGAGYRFAFQRIAGPMVRDLGFVPAALIGRAACYALVAAGLAVIAGAIGLRPGMLVLATIALITLHPGQSTTGGEWFVGGFEAKAIAWGLALLAIGLALHHRYPLAAVLAGVATSFHVLVGGWVTVALWLWLITFGRGGKPLTDRASLRTLAGCALCTVLGAAGAALPLWSHFSTPPTHADPSASFIYVFLRLPHHLSPASWQTTAWMHLAMFVIVFTGAVALLWRWAKPVETSRRADLHLAALVTFAMLPFVVGLLIATFDSEGSLLRYYPFRVGGVLLPLGAYLLAALAMQRCAERGGAWSRRALVMMSMLTLVGCFVMAARAFDKHLEKVAHATAPGGSGGNDGESWAAACDAVRALTPDGARVITPPAGGADFTWRTGRARVANFKQMPQSPEAIIEWYRRMQDLANGADLAALARSTPNYDAEDCRDALTHGYKSLTTVQAKALMDRYQADYFLTTADHRLDLPVLYDAERYILYAAPRLPTAKIDLLP
jgi:hypothetical protein